MKLSGYEYPNSFKAENLAAGYETAEQNFNKPWRASPGHDHNMLDGGQKVIGIARVLCVAQNMAGTGQPSSALRWTLPLTPPENPRVLSKKASEKTDKARDFKQDQDGVEDGWMNNEDDV